MGRNETAIVTLEEAKGRFEEWRSNRRGKGRIPAELWSAAVEVARKEGINRTARELHVAWDDLKRRMTTTRELCREKLETDPFSGCLFIFRSRRGTAIKLLAYDSCEAPRYVE